MPPIPPSAELPTHSFPSVSDFETFLERNHTTLPGFYLKLAKKASGIPSITAAEAVEVALCFGWIDGRANGVDDTWWTIRYTPRRAKSIWSKKNVATIVRLIEDGKMRPAGVEVVEAAKKDGRWDKAYAGPKDMVMPEDFKQVLQRNGDAERFWKGLNKSERYAVLWRIETTSVTARKSRIESLVGMLGEGRKVGAATVKPKQQTNDATGTEGVQKSKATPITKKSPQKRKLDALPVEKRSKVGGPLRREGLRRRP